jgi:hypothetical protein
LRDLARDTNAPWITHPAHLDATALNHPTIAAPLAEAMAARGLLPTEANPTAHHENTPQQPAPTLADRRRAGRQAERQAHRDQLQQRGPRPTRQAKNTRRAQTQRQGEQRANEQSQPTPQRPQQVTPRTQQPRPEQRRPRLG